MNDMLLSPHPLDALIPTILLFFGIAGLVVPLLQRLKISPVLGYLMCGVVCRYCSLA
jgi:CPA2 family monovalent cation:H+ antiporter-2